MSQKDQRPNLVGAVGRHRSPTPGLTPDPVVEPPTKPLALPRQDWRPGDEAGGLRARSWPATPGGHQVALGPAASHGRHDPRRRRRRLVAALASALGAVVVLGGAALWWQAQRPVVTPIATTATAPSAPGVGAASLAPESPGTTVGTTAPPTGACPSAAALVAVFNTHQHTHATPVGSSVCAAGFAVARVALPGSETVHAIFALGPPARFLESGSGPTCTDDPAALPGAVIVSHAAARKLNCATATAASAPSASTASPSSASGSASGAASGTRCGSVRAPGYSHPFTVTVTVGPVSCSDALRTATSYETNPPPPQDQAGTGQVESWTCSAYPGQYWMDTGHAEYCTQGSKKIAIDSPYQQRNG